MIVHNFYKIFHAEIEISRYRRQGENKYAIKKVKFKFMK